MSETSEDVIREVIALLARDEDKSSKDDITSWPLPLLLTDSGNAAMFCKKYRHEAAYTVGRGWMVWDGRVWVRDHEAALVARRMQTVAREWLEVAAQTEDTDTAKRIAQHAARSLDTRRINAALEAAARMMLTPDSAFDSDPFLLNVQNGIVDLRTGKLREHDPRVMCSRIAGAAYVPDAEAPRWRRFLSEIFGGDSELVEFALRWAGYCLTGDTREQRYLIAWGDGANGKSTFFNILKSVMGSYAVDISTSALAAKRDVSNLNTDIARLPGARLAVAPEWDEDLRADEVMLKSLTGQDTISVRTLYREPIEFRPQCKIVIHGNRKPVLRGTDTGTWRRPLLVPFTECFEGPRCDPRLSETLMSEAEGILASLVAACRRWQAAGLAIPLRVTSATEEYRRESDDVQQFIEQCCVEHPAAAATVGALHNEYVKWGGAIRTTHKFGRTLRELGYATEKQWQRYVVVGLGLAAQE